MPDAPAAPEAHPAVPAAPPEPAASAEPETVTMTKAEADALRRQVAEASKAQRKFEADQRKAEEDRQAEQGQFKELAEQRERELAAERGERSRIEREARITRLASKSKFIDPSDAIGRVTADEGQDDAGVEAALERIAKASPHLIAKEAPIVPEIGVVHAPAAGASPSAAAGDGKPPPPAGKAPVQSLDEFEALPQSERLARMAEADWLLANQQ